MSWHVVMATPEIERAAEELRRARASMVSPGVVQMSGDEGLATRARDPDGHVIELVQRVEERRTR